MITKEFFDVIVKRDTQPTYLVNKEKLLYPYTLNSTASTNHISDAEISELYVKHVVIGNSVLTFAREIIKRTKE